MAVPSELRTYARKRFNAQPGFWYMTKAKALKRGSIDQIIEYHVRLKEMAVGENWEPGLQQHFANVVAGRQVSSAWARELKIFFGLLGTAWVQDNNRVILTGVGQRFLATTDPFNMLTNQVRKYQLGNPSVKGGQCSGISVIPHHVLLKLLLECELSDVSKTEFIAFVSRILDADQDTEDIANLIHMYRKLSAEDRAKFAKTLDADKIRVTSRIWSYLANFLCIPDYLDYSNVNIRIADREAAERVLSWYEAGNTEHIEFTTEKDWFSHYGSEDSNPSPLDAIDYYRSTNNTERAKQVYRRAVRRGHLRPDVSEEDFGCRIQGEAKIEEWLAGHLDRLEPGLQYEQRQYETADAGRMDILARDQSGAFVVIELKRDKAHDAAFGQLLRYMGWVRMYLSDGAEVRGYVLGEDIDDRMVYATLASTELDHLCKLLRYSDLGICLDLHRSAGDCSAEVIDLFAHSTP